MITMFDSISPDVIPHDAPAVAGYVGGHWPTYTTLRQRFPHARTLSIAVASDQDAECLDVEPGDVPPELAAAWVRRQQARGVQRPVVYASRDAMPHLLKLLSQAGIGRGSVRVWSAHYTGRAHLCGTACGAHGFEADATQWTDHSHGRSLDESICRDDFFPGHHPSGPRDLARGMHGHDVVTLKKHLHKRGYRPPRRLGRYPRTFGINTEAFVEHFQHHHGLTADGVVGAHTRRALGL